MNLQNVGNYSIYHSTWRNIPEDFNLLISFDSYKDKFWRTCYIIGPDLFQLLDDVIMILLNKKVRL
jgi:hypothetical protein